MVSFIDNFKWEREPGRSGSSKKAPGIISLSNKIFSETRVAYNLLRRTGWLKVVVNGTCQIPNGNFQKHAACSISTTFSRKKGSRMIHTKRPGTSKS